MAGAQFALPHHLLHFFGQLQQGIQCAAFLVGGGELEIFEFQPDIRAGNLGQGLRMQHRRFDDLPGNAARGGAHMVDREKRGRLLVRGGAGILLAHGGCPYGARTFGAIAQKGSAAARFTLPQNAHPR